MKIFHVICSGLPGVYRKAQFLWTWHLYLYLPKGPQGIVDFGPWLSAIPAHPIMANTDEIIYKKKLKMK